MSRFPIPIAGAVLGIAVAFAGCSQNERAEAVSTLSVQRLRCEYLAAPMAVETPRPRFSWAMESESRDELQTAYQVLVASSADNLAARKGDLWDSGQVKSSQSVHVEYAGAQLTSGQQCFWAVRAWNRAGKPSEWSAPARFEMGLLNRSDWQGSWIGGNRLLRKEFVLDQPAVSARVYVAAMGYYVLYINGERVGDEQLAPGQTDYTKRVLYQAQDVSAFLKRGPNVIALELGAGWLHPGMVRDGLVTGYPAEPCALVQLNVTGDKGDVTRVVSDASWQAMSGPIIQDQLNIGEVYDARQERPGWNLPAYSAPDAVPASIATSNPDVKITALKCQPDRVVDALRATYLTQPEPGVWVLDMAQNCAGWARLTVQGEPGTRIELRFAEKLAPSGRLDDYTSYHQQDVYILKGGGVETWRPKFTWHGFRYVEISGYPGEPNLDSVVAEVVHTDVAPASQFATGDDLLNSIQNATLWSQRSNMHGGVPSDCPHRERLGYGGDGQVCAEMAIYNFDMAPFYTKWLDDIADAQHADGFVPHTAPSLGGGGGPAWSCAYVIIPWEMYRYYGDTRILAEHYDGMKRWVEFLAGKTKDYIVQPYGGEWEFLGDWCPPDRAQDTDNWKDQEGAILMSTFYYHMVVDMLSKTARVLGNEADAKAYAERADAIKAAFNAKYYDAARKAYHTGLQADNAFALAAGFPSEEDAPAVVDHVVKDIAEHEGHLDTGIFGTKYLLDVLTRYGRVDVAHGVATQTSYPSWGYMIGKGATTLWEQWNGVYSNNHPMFGTISEWYFKGLAGIRIDERKPGFEHVEIRPAMPSEMRRARGNLDTLRGEIVSSWRQSGQQYSVEATLPANTTGTVYLPKPVGKPVTVTLDDRAVWQEDAYVDGSEGVHGAVDTGTAIAVEVGSGRYEFSVSLKR